MLQRLLQLPGGSSLEVISQIPGYWVERGGSQGLLSLRGFRCLRWDMSLRLRWVEGGALQKGDRQERLHHRGAAFLLSCWKPCSGMHPGIWECWAFGVQLQRGSWCLSECDPRASASAAHMALIRTADSGLSPVARGHLDRTALPQTVLSHAELERAGLWNLEPLLTIQMLSSVSGWVAISHNARARPSGYLGHPKAS